MDQNNFNAFLNKELNENQKEAVLQSTGPMLVIAGAGSGKTRVITSRITNLILNENVNPSSIIALTFTNKAAREMKERVQKFIPDLKILPYIGTFHSFCLQLLKKYQSFLKIENFSILDDDDQLKIIKLIINKFALNKQVNANSILYQISNFKNNQIVDAANMLFEDRLFEQIYLEYEKEKRNSRCFDFDDLLIEVLKLLKSNKEFKNILQSTIKHVLVDEYQDTNLVQHELLKELCKRDNELVVSSVCAVGDEDQSIYSWRGATVENILKYQKDFPKTKLIKIEQNYRSVNQILEVANEVIKNNENRNPKKLWSEKKASNRILKLTSLTNYRESDNIANYVKLVKLNNPKESIAVLYRTHFQSRTIEEALLKNSITYKIIGGIQFYDRKEIKDLIAYLKMIVNPFDKISMLRILNVPARNLGAKSEEIIINEWNANPLLDIFGITEYLIKEQLFTGKKAESLISFIKTLTTALDTKSISKTIKNIVEETDYITYLKAEFEKTESAQKIDNVNEFIRSAEHFEENESNQVSDFLEKIALLQEKMNEQDTTDTHVQLMSLHAAKGLEFDHVIISGIEEGLLPSSRSLNDANQIEEERRLFYVGITRARERLLLFNSQMRNSYGHTESQIASRFFNEIPKNLITEHDVSYWNEFQTKDLIGSFLGLKTHSSKVVTFASSTQKPTFAKKTDLAWGPKSFVSHPVFGTGMVDSVENRANGSTVLTIRFKNGSIKKLDSSFVKKI